MDLKRVLFVLFRYKSAIAALVIVSLLAAGAFAFLKAPTYEASAQILVKVGREISAPAQDILEGGGFASQKRKEDIFAEVEILESLHVLEQVVNEIGAETILYGEPDPDAAGEGSSAEPSALARWIGGAFRWVKEHLSSDGGAELSPAQQAVAVLDAGVTIEAVIRSDTIRMRYADEDPNLALRVVDTLLSKYLERHIEVHKGGQMDVVFQPQVDHYAKALSDLEDQIDTLEKGKNIFALEAQRSELIHQQAMARAALEETHRAIVPQERKVERIQAQINSTDEFMELPGARDQNPGIDSLRARLVELKLKREELMRSSHTRDIEALSAEIARAKELLAEEQQRVLHSNRMELADLKLRSAALQSDIEAYQESLQVIDAVAAQRNKLERERTITEQNYLLYVGELEQARISAVMDLARITNVRVIQPATVASSPDGPSAAFVAAITLALSLLLGVPAVFLLDYLDHSIKTGRDIEVHLGLPVLGSIAEEGGSVTWVS